MSVTVNCLCSRFLSSNCSLQWWEIKSCTSSLSAIIASMSSQIVTAVLFLLAPSTMSSKWYSNRDSKRSIIASGIWNILSQNEKWALLLVTKCEQENVFRISVIAYCSVWINVARKHWLINYPTHLAIDSCNLACLVFSCIIMAAVDTVQRIMGHTLLTTTIHSRALAIFIFINAIPPTHLQYNKNIFKQTFLSAYNSDYALFLIPGSVVNEMYQQEKTNWTE